MKANSHLESRQNFILKGLTIFLLLGFLWSMLLIKTESHTRPPMALSRADTNVKQLESTKVPNLNLQCKPKSDIVFLKTHKCSSSTIQNILMRFAQKSDLTLVLPKQQYYLRELTTGFTINSVADTLWWKAKLKPNIFLLHAVYNEKEFEKLFGDKLPFYFSILRDPVSLFISFWDYYNLSQSKLLKGWTVEQFAFSLGKPNVQKLFGGARFKDTLLGDFGMDNRDLSNMTRVQEKVAQVEGKFTFMMFVERFRESVVLLKHHLCWSYEDMASLRLNAIDPAKKSSVSAEAREQLKLWLNSSYIFYNHFKAKFEKEIEDFGADQMKEELAKLDAVNQQAEESCQVEFVDGKTLPAGDRPYGHGVLGYKIHGTDPQCQWLAIQELKYVDIMRKHQEAKAESILAEESLTLDDLAGLSNQTSG